MADETETKRYLDYDGLKYLIEKLTNRIEASGGGGSSWVPEPGAYVAYTDADGVNRIAKPSEYKSDGNTPCGVLVVHGGGSLLVNLNAKESTHYTTLSDGNETGGYIADDLDSALLDMDGRRNTDLALQSYGMSDPTRGEVFDEYLGFASLAQVDFKGGWWFPSMGELRIIHDNLDAVEECLAVCGGKSLYDVGEGVLLSSTRSATTSVWAWNLKDNSAESVSSGDEMGIIPVSRFAWVPDGYSGGGEPEYVEPEPEPEPDPDAISVEPAVITNVDYDGWLTKQARVTSTSDWRAVWDSTLIDITPASGGAGETEIEVGIAGDGGDIDEIVRFEDSAGNAAELRVISQDRSSFNHAMTLTIVPTPDDATVVIDGVERREIMVEHDTAVDWTVSKDGYNTQSGVYVVFFEDANQLNVKLSEADAGGYEGALEVSRASIMLSTPGATVQTLKVCSETNWWVIRNGLNYGGEEEWGEDIEVRPRSGTAGVSEVTISLRTIHKEFSHVVEFANDADEYATVTVSGLEWDE